ncbi:universal stress protein [Natronococcus wangiae]|uniref:universal stress protein n=1 Tax=Natronococcus wangiae TaxID=3068275 RepID=UPI00273DC96B|nr:universal stress protein [Natronococcus sp. AD5]
MPRRILVPFDGSESAREALEYAIELFPDGEFVALTVVDTSAVPFIPNTASPETNDELRAMLREADEELGIAERLADDADVDLEPLTRIGSPAQEIVDCTESESIDHVVMGSHGRSGVTRILLGSVAEVVVRHSSAPVTVVR